ncbi:olfactory receptor 6N1-like [Erythrolamprus reginae]|uniref:olfactory receptor 6N1-like n=1 Tax=Erythrolamprus reginae TaxID=121349 RepID=UPI00396C9BE9
MLGIEKEKNQSSIREFILLGFGNLPEVQLFLFWSFLVIYLMTIFGNLLIFLLVVADQHLHTPMYFFLSNLSCLDTCYSFNFLPKMLTNLLTGERTISVNGCLAQYHFFCMCESIETYLLAAMSYDRYLAICRPLKYASVMNIRFCFQLMVAIGIHSLIFNVILVTVMAQLTFCGPNVIDHYFCDLYPLMKLSCSDTSLFERFAFCMTIIFTIPPFLLTLTSYICIIITIINIKSITGRHKAFSTCSSHLMVVCLFYGILLIAYALPVTPTLRYLNKIISIFYTIMTPLINPLIYTLRNKEVHKALRRNLGKMMIFLSFVT